MQGLEHIIYKSITEFNDGITFSVPQYRLDDIPELQNLSIDAIKIDVENFEYQVFLGAKHLIIQHKPIIYCELWNNENRVKCLELMKEWGYSIFVLQENKLVSLELHSYQTQNFFFIYS
jgi:hypothetical protein